MCEVYVPPLAFRPPALCPPAHLYVTPILSAGSHAVEIYNPGRRIVGRGWPRTVQLDEATLGTLFYDLEPVRRRDRSCFFLASFLLPRLLLLLSTAASP